MTFTRSTRSSGRVRSAWSGDAFTVTRIRLEEKIFKFQPHPSSSCRSSLSRSWTWQSSPRLQAYHWTTSRGKPPSATCSSTRTSWSCWRPTPARGCSTWCSSSCPELTFASRSSREPRLGSCTARPWPVTTSDRSCRSLSVHNGDTVILLHYKTYFSNTIDY